MRLSIHLWLTIVIFLAQVGIVSALSWWSTSSLPAISHDPSPRDAVERIPHEPRGLTTGPTKDNTQHRFDAPLRRSKKQYLSGNPRWHAKREMSLWDYDRHTKRVGHFDPLVSVNWAESGDANGKIDVQPLNTERDYVSQDTAANSTAPLPTLRQGTVLEHGQPHTGRPLASLVDEDEARRQTLLSLGGMVTFDLLHDDDFDAAWPHKLDDTVTTPQDLSINTSSTPISVLDGGPRMYADKIIWQFTSTHPPANDLSRRRKDESEVEEEEEEAGTRDHQSNDGAEEDGSDGGYRKVSHASSSDNGSFPGQSKSDRYDEDEEQDVTYGHTGKGRLPTEEDDTMDIDADGKGKGSRKQIDTASDSFDLADDSHRSKATEPGRARPEAGVAQDGDDRRQHDPPDSSRHTKTATEKGSSTPGYDDGQYHPDEGSGSDCAALSSFYEAMHGESWSSLSDWNSKRGSRSGCCQWTGVSCDVNHRVVALDLANADLEGELDETIFELEGLVRLDIANNNLTSLPDRFASLPFLANLNASHNALSGSVPSSLLSHDMLKVLNLASNTLTGSVSIDSANMTSINLAGNSFTSITILEGPSLVKVDLSQNAFAGALPDLAQSTGLQIFDASFNNFTGPLFDTTRLTSLTRLDVRSNSLSGPFPASFSHLSRLTSLYLSANRFSGPFPSEPAPPYLRSCNVMPNTISPCPSEIELAHPESLASRCHVRCTPAGIPVSPLPGEAGRPFSLAAPPGPQAPAAAIPVLAPPSGLGVPVPSLERSDVGSNGESGARGTDASAQRQAPGQAVSEVDAKPSAAARLRMGRLRIALIVWTTALPLMIDL